MRVEMWREDEAWEVRVRGSESGDVEREERETVEKVYM